MQPSGPRSFHRRVCLPRKGRGNLCVWSCCHLVTAARRPLKLWHRSTSSDNAACEATGSCITETSGEDGAAAKIYRIIPPCRNSKFLEGRDKELKAHRGCWIIFRATLELQSQQGSSLSWIHTRELARPATTISRGQRLCHSCEIHSTFPIKGKELNIPAWILRVHCSCTWIRWQIFWDRGKYSYFLQPKGCRYPAPF